MYFSSNFVYKKAKPAAPAPQAYNDETPDTNVVTISFTQLKDVANMHAGDPVKCFNCDGYLSHISKLNDVKSGAGAGRVWTCEFCNFQNNIQLDSDEVPKIEDVTYMIEPAGTSMTESGPQQEAIDSEYIVYCIDISGSMSCTTEVKGNFKLPTDELKAQREAQLQLEDEPLYRPPSHVRHITRLEAVQVAITENLAKLEKENPNKRVCLVTFNHELKVYGDGLTQELTVSGDALERKQSIEDKVQLCVDLKPIKATKNVLHDKIIRLEEDGATALGPALYYSILIASRKRGSKVILCTDGLANKGIGALDNGADDTNQAFYNDLATTALANGVSVSIVTIEGTDCKLGCLGLVADKTGGVVDVVNPLNIKSQFSSIIEDQIIATSVVAKFMTHKAMYIKDYEDLNSRQSFILRNVGNVTQDTEITFEFKLRDDSDIDEKAVKELPFQLQITYLTKDGAKALRILTQLRPLTNDRYLAERSADRTILATHFSQLNAKLIQRGPKSKVAYEANHSQWNDYIRNINNTDNADGFKIDDYDEMERDMRDVMVPVSNIQREEASNAYSEVADSVAKKGFKLSKISSRFFKK